MKDPRIPVPTRSTPSQYPWRILRVYADGERGTMACVSSREEAEKFVARMKQRNPYRYVIEGPS